MEHMSLELEQFNDDETEASGAEYVVVGVCGVLLFLVLLGLAGYCLVVQGRRPNTLLFFFCLIVFCILELPRYFLMALDSNYSSAAGYSVHLVATMFFFAALSIVCRYWSSLMSLGEYSRAVYGTVGLTIANIVFGVIDIISIGLCLNSKHLEAYFNSTGYLVIIIIEASKNLVYSWLLAYYGIKLIAPFWQFSRAERKNAYETYSVGLIKFLVGAISGNTTENQFTVVCVRMTSVLVLCTFCFSIRVVMLIIKIVALYSVTTSTSESFTLFGFVWFLFADFIPRGVPCAAFMYLMSLTKPTKEEREGGFGQAPGSSPTIKLPSQLRQQEGKDTEDGNIEDGSPMDGVGDGDEDVALNKGINLFSSSSAGVGSNSGKSGGSNSPKKNKKGNQYSGVELAKLNSEGGSQFSEDWEDLQW